MKRLGFISLVLIVALMLVGVLSSCNKVISGTYYSGDKEQLKTYVEFEFSFSKIHISQVTLGNVSWETDASYKIKGDKIVIEIPEDASILATAYNGEFKFEQGDGYIKIGSHKYALDK